jgi:hypothetical protein
LIRLRASCRPVTFCALQTIAVPVIVSATWHGHIAVLSLASGIDVDESVAAASEFARVCARIEVRRVPVVAFLAGVYSAVTAARRLLTLIPDAVHTRAAIASGDATNARPSVTLAVPVTCCALVGVPLSATVATDIAIAHFAGSGRRGATIAIAHALDAPRRPRTYGR